MIGIAIKKTVFLCGSKMSTFLYKNIFTSCTTDILYTKHNTKHKQNDKHQVYTKPYMLNFIIFRQSASSLN